MKQSLSVIGFVALVGFLSGCGPVVSGIQIVKANVALSAAETAGAKDHALYEYTAAKEYLTKAREEHGYSDFAESRVYADKALQYAVEARNRAADLSTLEGPAVIGPSSASEPTTEPVIVPAP